MSATTSSLWAAMTVLAGGRRPHPLPPARAAAPDSDCPRDRAFPPVDDAMRWEVGPATDVAVLEQVYSAVRVRDGDAEIDADGQWDWRPGWRFPDGTVLTAVGVPLYSLDTEAAWHLLLTLIDMGWKVDVGVAGSATRASTWRASASHAHPARVVAVDAPTAALAICRLALCVTAQRVV